MKQFFQNIGTSDIRNILGITTVIGCFILLYLMMIKEIPAGNKDVVNIAVGFIFGGLLAGVAGFYFGASKKERDTKEPKP